MDPPPPLPPQPSIITTAATTTNQGPYAAVATTHLNYPNSAESSPRSSHHAEWDEPLPQVPGAKLRLMCSYSGHIIPRPHDKSLCYIGGETRIVGIDRNSSLAELSSKLSRTLLHGRSFTFKYQLPSEDLDSLISVATDEDLENMIDEYDRIMSTSPIKPSRLRIFLFLSKPETAASMGAMLDGAKSETWFVDALNGAADLLSRGVSDSAAIDDLLSLDSGVTRNDSGTELAGTQNEQFGNHGKQANISGAGHDVQSIQSVMPDSPMVEKTSSFDSSTASSPPMANLPHIRVRSNDELGARLPEQRGGIEEQFIQLNVAQPAANVTAAGGTMPNENYRRAESFRKPPLPLQLQTLNHKHSGGFNLPSPDSKHAGSHNLPSPDSVASDTSIASSCSLSKQVYQVPNQVPYAESLHHTRSGESQMDSNIQTPQVQISTIQDSGYAVPPQHHESQQQQHQQQQHQQQFMHYMHHPAGGHTPISSYYPVYATPSQQQSIHPPMDQQYPMYLLPVSHNSPYNMGLQPNTADATAVTSIRPLTPPNPSMVPSSAGAHPSFSTTGANSAVPPPGLVQVPANQFQQQYVGCPQYANTAQPVANYGYEYAHPSRDQVYYGNQSAVPVSSQYQTMTAATAAMLVEASKQQANENNQQRARIDQQI